MVAMSYLPTKPPQLLLLVLCACCCMSSQISTLGNCVYKAVAPEKKEEE